MKMKKKKKKGAKRIKKHIERENVLKENEIT
jgi:hypothetical protein